MKYYLYKITNWFNGKVYVGVHKTSDLNDGYMGSGKVLKRAIEKYGLGYFTKEILQVFDSSEEMFEAEAQVVNEDFVQSNWTYNLKVGGFGGFDHLNGDAHNNLGNWRKLGNHGWKNRGEFTEERKQKIFSGLMNYIENTGGSFVGRTHTEETKKKMSNSAQGKHSGEKNSQFGTCWVCLPGVEDSAKKIRKEELEIWLGLGWSKGRK